MDAFLAASAATAGDGLPVSAPAAPSFGSAVGATALVLLLSSLALYTYTRWPQPTGIGGPPPYPFVGNVFHIDAHNLPKSFDALHATYGRVVKLHLGPRVMVSVADAGLAEAIFTSSRGGVVQLGPVPLCVWAPLPAVRHCRRGARVAPRPPPPAQRRCRRRGGGRGRAARRAPSP
eukprot:TRINITY_DN3511_c0_g1_i1.p1 TRINITY_DN3511_c0_g1~~TRINITY_DN3511_c0_g1_i1.p1  ORF type:complete len:195 (-),score=39.49 TRINITY_DN3511_c0_g1_i1:719-1246(-)